MTRRCLCFGRVLLIAAVLIVLLLEPGFASNFPVRPITIVCPWAAGGGTDRITRYVADQLKTELGVPVVVDNRTGGNGAVGHGAGAKSRADGYTVTNVTLELATIPWLGLTDISHKDFAAVIQINEDAAGVIVKADAPWKTLKDLLDHIKANPGKLFFSGTAAGGIWDLARIGMLNTAGIPVDAVTWVPTTGAAPSIVELLGGHVHVITCSLAEAASQLQAGTLRALAVMADSRNPSFPNVPTLKESGINWSAGTWRGYAVPAGTPQEVVDVLYKGFSKVAESEGFKDFMMKNGFGVRVRGPKDFQAFMAAQHETWKTVLQLGGYLK